MTEPQTERQHRTPLERLAMCLRVTEDEINGIIDTYDNRTRTRAHGWLSQISKIRQSVEFTTREGRR